MCYDHTSVYEPRRAGSWDVSRSKLIKLLERTPTLANTHTHTHTRTLSILPYEAAAWQVPLVVSDTCGRNVGRGRQQARAELQHRFSLECRRANTLCGLKPRSPDCGLGYTAEIAFGTERRPTTLTALFFPLPSLCVTAGGCGRRLELVGAVAAVLQDVRRRGGVLLQGVH